VLFLFYFRKAPDAWLDGQGLECKAMIKRLVMASFAFWFGEEKNEVKTVHDTKHERRDSGLGFDPTLEVSPANVELNSSSLTHAKSLSLSNSQPQPQPQPSWFSFTVERMTRFFSDEEDESFYAWVEEQNKSRYGSTPGVFERTLDGVVDYFGIGEPDEEPEADDDRRRGIDSEREILFDVQELQDMVENEEKVEESVKDKKRSHRRSSVRFPPVAIMANEYL